MSRSWLIVLIIIIVAAFFRLYQLDVYPPGLYPDEAMNGNNAIQALETGNYKVFYTENNGREGLFMNLIAGSIAIFGKKIWALRIVSAIAGILTVWGLYLLTKELFNRQIAYLSSAMLAVSFWHVLFSRISFRAIMAPMFLVFALYFMWRGLKTKHLALFGLSGLFWGLGFYTYIAFRIIPLAALITLLVYWWKIKLDFDHEKYRKTRMDIARGLALLMIVTIFVSLPLAWYFYQNPGDFLGRTTQVSIFSTENPIKTLALNLGKSLAMFNFVGDWNWRHNYAGEPTLLWPVGALFMVGFFRSIIKCLRLYKKHGHFSTVQTLLLAWFFVGLLPAVLSSEGIPHALRVIILAPVVYIFAAEGLWWLYELINSSYHARDVDEVRIRHSMFPESNLMATLAVVLFLVAVGIANYNKYFNQWGPHTATAAYFNQNYVDLGNKINEIPESIKKYILVNSPGVLVNGIPMSAQTVMFVTDTSTIEKQKAKNIIYITEEEFIRTRIERDAMVIPMEE